MLLAAEHSALFIGIGVAGFAVIVLYSLGVAFATLRLIAETNNDCEFEIMAGGFALWLSGLTVLLFITAIVQVLVAGK
jgi:hypothetical protein